MKRLDRKGFTLVELLAVIVILAIVVGITLVTVLPTLKNSRQKAFELTAQTAADYFEKQYQLYLIGEELPSDVKNLIGGGLAAGNNGTNYMTGSHLSYAGLKPENYIRGTFQLNSNTGRVCIILTASTNETAKASTKNLANEATAGEYYDVEDNAKSSACS